MKKCIIPLSIVALLMASCSIEEESPVAVGGSRMTLTGDSHTATKVSIGEKDGEVYPLLWFTGDVISINSTDGTFSDEQAELYSASSGSSSGIFQTVNDLTPASDMDLVILYPGSSLSYSTYDQGVIRGSVPSEQTQRSANSSVHIGNGCFAYAETSVAAGQTEDVKFSLQHKTAFVKVVVKMDEYSDYYLSSVSFDAGDGFALSGDVTYDMGADEMTVANPESRIKVSISNTSLLSSAQEVYFTALPCDLTGQQVYMSVRMVKDSEIVEVPLFIEGGVLKESCLTIISIDGDDIDIPDWYEPAETRDFLGGWAYGAQNTYLVEDGQSITIEVKARGDFNKVKEPKYYGLLTHSSSYDSNEKLCYLPNGIFYHETDVPTNKVSDDYTITVLTYGNSSDLANWAVVGLYDEDYNIIWSFMIWKYNPGDEPTGVKYPRDFVLLDRNLGAPYSNKVAEEKGTFGLPHAYFQWGRKDAFPWNQITIYDVTSAPEGFSIFDSVSQPNIMYADLTNGEYNVDWKEGRFDLWGGEDNTWSYDGVSGHKTVFDPCPEGWRVPDAWAMYYVWSNLEHWQIKTDKSFQDASWVNEDSPFYEAGESTFVCMASDGSYDYWPFAGFQWLSNPNKYSNNAGLKNLAAAYPSNGAISETRSMGFHLVYYSSGLGLYTDYVEPFWGTTVRCQKED